MAEARVRVRNKQTGETVMVHGAQVVSSYQRALPTRGTTDLLKAYSVSPVLQAVVRKIASAMADVEWIAKARDPLGDEIEISGHMAARLINGGVPGLDGHQCRMLEQTSIELVGESYAVMDRNRLGAPEMRWPIPAHWVKAVPYPNQDTFDVQPIGSKPVQVPRWDMIWHKDADPYDPYRRGVGIARSLSDELTADEMAAKHIGASLANRARPDLVVSGSKEVPLGSDDAVRLSEVWKQRFGGPENAGRPFVSAAPITVNTLTPSFRELQLSDMREFERDIIVSVFGVPPEILGIIENSNRATIDAAEYLFSKYVLRPRLSARKAVYNEQLAPQYDERLSLDFVDPVQENREFKQSVMSSRPSAFTDDEIRDLADMPPLPDGEGETRPASNLPAGAAPPGPASRGAVLSARGRAAKALREDQIDEILAAIDRDLMARVMRSAARETIGEFATDAIDELGLSIAFDIESPDVLEFLGRTAGERSNLINGTTEKQLRKTLVEGAAEGEAQGKLIDRVMSVVTDASAARADMIARTETTRAAAFATNEAFHQAGITEKEWLAVQDDRTRDTHADMDGQKQPVGTPFQSSSGGSAMYPGEFGLPEEDINCRCVVAAADSMADKAARVERWNAKAASMDRREAVFSRQLRSVFRQQGQQVVEALEGK